MGWSIFKFKEDWQKISKKPKYKIGDKYILTYFLGEISVPGFTAQILVTVFFCGLILMGIGIVGKYIGRIISEITGLPRYVVRKMTNEDRLK